MFQVTNSFILSCVLIIGYCPAAVALSSFAGTSVTMDLISVGSSVSLPSGWVSFMEQQKSATPLFNACEYMGKYEVTQEQYVALTGITPRDFQGGKYPAVRISWIDALYFCELLTRDHSASLPPGYVYSLPTSFEWETCAFPGGDFASALSAETLLSSAWIRENSNEKLHPVGLKESNRYGFYDMLGNAWEFCLDNYGNSFAPEGENVVDAVYLFQSCKKFRGGDCRMNCEGLSDPSLYRYKYAGGVCSKWPWRGFRVVIRETTKEYDMLRNNIVERHNGERGGCGVKSVLE